MCCKVLDENDEWIKRAEEAVETLETLGVHPIDLWPICERSCLILSSSVSVLILMQWVSYHSEYGARNLRTT